MMSSVKRMIPMEGDLTHSFAGEHYGRVAGHLLALGHCSQQVLVTSMTSDEGKTVTAVNIALALKVRRVPVLLAELSLARPKFAQIYASSPRPAGIEDVILGKASLKSVVCVLNENQLSIAMVKNQQQVDDKLLSPSSGLDSMIQQARNMYEWTIFDAPSVDSSSHIKSLAASVGMVIVVARARQTKAECLRNALTHIDHPNTMVLLNDT
jgi:Mrp family chromosome partitioning ATPase